MTDRIQARYWIETAYPLAQAAATMAGEQSTGTFLRVPGETDELRERYAARVESIIEGAPGAAAHAFPAPAHPRTGMASDGLQEVTLSWPLHKYRPAACRTCSPPLPAISPSSKPSQWPQSSPRPDPPARVPHGVSGPAVRRGKAPAPSRTLITGARSSAHASSNRHIGMSPEATAEQVRVLAEAGITASSRMTNSSPTARTARSNARIVTAVLQVLNRHARPANS